MTRIVVRTAKGPKHLRLGELTDDLWLCQCGLSRSQPFCDGSHKLTLDERPGVLYEYQGTDGARVRAPVQVAAQGPAEEPRHRP